MLTIKNTALSLFVMLLITFILFLVTMITYVTGGSDKSTNIIIVLLFLDGKAFVWLMVISAPITIISVYQVSISRSKGKISRKAIIGGIFGILCIIPATSLIGMFINLSVYYKPWPKDKPKDYKIKRRRWKKDDIDPGAKYLV